MADTLRSLIASVMGVDVQEIGDDAGESTVATWDSMRQLMLASVLESEYGFTLTMVELQRLKSLVEVRAILAAHGVAG